MCIPINPSQTNFTSLDQLMAMAKTMKGCEYFLADANSRVLYGVYGETIIRWLRLPLNIGLPMSLRFRLGNVDIDFINEHKDFKPLNQDASVLSTIDDNVPSVSFIPPDRTNFLLMQKAMNAIYNFQSTSSSLTLVPSIFGNMEQDPVIQEVMSNKITEGSKYIQLTGMNGKRYGFMIWRSLFSLNKGDSLTIKIYDRIDDGRLFMVIFEVEKKKSPIPTIIPHYIETTHSMCINLVQH